MLDVFALNLRHLLLVRAVAHSGSLGRAAPLVFLSQPAMTQAIASLERRLEHQLFTRDHQGMKPTLAGDIVVARMDAACAQLEAGALSLQGIDGKKGFGVVGRLTGLIHLRALIALSRAGSVALAAQAAGLSEASLRRAARDLESLAGTALFEQQGRALRISPPAAAFARHAGLAIREIEAMLAELAALHGVNTERIVIGAMPFGLARIVPNAIHALRQEWPNVAIRVTEGPYHSLLGALRAGEIDFMVGALRNPLPAPDISQEPLCESRTLIVGRAGHPLQHGRPVTPATLALYPWIIAHPGTPLRQSWIALFEQDGVALPPYPVECGATIAIRQLLLSGDYLTLLSAEQFAIEQNAGLIAQIGQIGGARRSIGVATRQDWRATQVQKAFMEKLRQHR